MSLDTEIVFKALSCNCRSVLVEGFTEGDYQRHVDAMKQMIEEHGGMSIDFIDLLDKDIGELYDTPEAKLIFVYNLDLFGNSIEPNNATKVMRFLRGKSNTRDDVRELMIARPNANLDYNSRKGYTYHDNHPLGNWCSFYRIENGKLVEYQNPIEHRK